MKTLILATIMISAMVAGSLHAQIYADFTVSHPDLTDGSGAFRVRLDYDKAPRTCANFIGLATGERPWLDTTQGKVITGKKYYDGLTFHRLVQDFMIQGGDPQGTGNGGPGYVFQDEFHTSLRHNKKYVLSMANSGVCTNGSQFFIMLVDNWMNASSLDDKHSVFGEVITGTDTLDEFTNTSKFANSGPPNNTLVTPVTIDSVVVSGPDLATFDINDTALLLPTVRGVNTKISHNPVAGEYIITWDRKNQAEYLSTLSNDLSAWGFVGSPYLISLEAATDWSYTITGVTEDRFFSRLTEVDYTLLPNAPADMTASGKKVEITINPGETVTLTFDGAGGGTWLHSDTSSGTLSGVTWTDSAPSAGIFSSSVPQAKFIPLGTLAVAFDSPMGSDAWSSLDMTTSFHTATTGWFSGSVEVPVFPPVPGGTSTMTESKKCTFVYLP